MSYLTKHCLLCNWDSLLACSSSYPLVLCLCRRAVGPYIVHTAVCEVPTALGGPLFHLKGWSANRRERHTCSVQSLQPTRVAHFHLNNGNFKHSLYKAVVVQKGWSSWVIESVPSYWQQSDHTTLFHKLTSLHLKSIFFALIQAEGRLVQNLCPRMFRNLFRICSQNLFLRMN